MKTALPILALLPLAAEATAEGRVPVHIIGNRGIDTDDLFNNSVAYIQGWLRALENDSNLVVRAAQAAQKATDHILGIEAYKADNKKADSKADKVDEVKEAKAA